MLQILASGDGSPITRRERLIEVITALSDEETLSQVAGKDALIDCSLYLMAKDNAELSAKLRACLDTDELMQDVKHVQRTYDIRNAARRLEEAYAGI